MNTILMAVDDGITNANYNAADIFFLIATVAAGLAALGYFTATVTATDPPRRSYHAWAAALVAVAIACTAFALFLL